MILTGLGVLVVLGSWWALPSYGLAGLLLVARTALEDRVLRAELAGYADYARRVRWRLAPGIW
jgi:protein-S-isoprenylcysteine O-methyltransferase Ste14